MPEYFRTKQDDPKLRERRTTIVDLNGEEYRANRAEQAARAHEFLPAFGETVTSSLFDRDKILEAGYLVSRLQRLLIEGNDLNAAEIRALFQEVLATPAVRDHEVVQSATRQAPGAPDAGSRMTQALQARKISPELMAKICEAHVQRFQRERVRFDQELPALKEEFMERLFRLADQPSHPLPADLFGREYVEQRINQVAIVAADPLELIGRSDIAIGEYNHDRNYAALLYDRSSVFGGASHHKLYRYVLWHELGHVVSGRRVVEKNGSMTGERIGLHQYDRANRVWRYSWLNEAITEQLTHDMWNKGARDYNYGTYRDEREVYKRLLQRVPEELFLRAFAENDNPSQPNDGQVQVPRLFAAIDATYGDGFSVQLDDRITRDGVDQVTRLFDVSGNWVG